MVREERRLFIKIGPGIAAQPGEVVAEGFGCLRKNCALTKALTNPTG